MIPKEAKSVFYIGKSMYPSFRNLDRLFYVPYGGRAIRPGDVVVMGAPIGQKVVHRVLSIDGSRVTTMGDYCLEPDSWTLDPEQILGQVVLFCRDGRFVRVNGGLRGRLWANTVRCFRRILYILGNTLKRPYDLLAGSLAKEPFRQYLRVYSFQRPEGREVQLMIGRRIIGRRALCGQWQIKPPFKLFLNRKLLDDLDENEV